MFTRWMLGASLCGILSGFGPALAAPFVPARDAHCVAFSQDGALVATGISGLSNEEFPPRPHPNPRKCGVVQVWSLETGKRLRRFETFGDLTRVAFSPNNRWVAASRLFTTADRLQLNEVRVWDLATGATVLALDRCHAFHFAPQGNAIAIASQWRCVVYDLTTGDKLKQFPALAGAFSITYAPDGGQLLGVRTQGSGCGLTICQVADPNQQQVSVALDQPFYTATFSPDGMLLASGHMGHVLVWDAHTLQPIRRVTTAGRAIQHPFFSPDSSLLGTGDQGNGDVMFWDLASGSEIARYTFEKGLLHTYRVRAPDERVAPERDPARFVFSPDGHSFLAGPHGGILRRVDTGQDTRRFGD